MNEKQLPTEQTHPTASSFPSAGDLLLLLGGYFLIAAFTSILITAWELMSNCQRAAFSANTQGFILLIVSLITLGLSVAFFRWYHRRRGALLPPIGFAIKKPHLKTFIAAFVITFTASIVLEPIFKLLPDINQHITPSVWSLVSVAVVAPFAEEYLCRGLLFGSLLQRYGTTPAVLLSALFFGVMHVIPTAAFNAFIIGLVLATLYLATRSLWAPILLHALNNIAAYLLLTAGYGDMLLSELLADHPTHYWLLYIIAATLFGFAAHRLILEARKATIEVR